MENKSVLEEMFNIYGKPTVDWMGYKVTKNNYLTYHHIVEARNGGRETTDNGALLSVKAHELLNMVEVYNPELYEEYQFWFRLINDLKSSPCDEIMGVMYELKKRLNTCIKEKKANSKNCL